MKRLTTAFAVCLFFLVLGAKWAFIDLVGSDMPDWDQWDAEGLNLLTPWFEHDHFVQHLFQPHNEHRVVLTKLQNLGVTLLAGQWDGRLESVINAFLHSALAIGFFVGGCRWLGPRWIAFVFILTAAMFGCPLAWQNVIEGFHSQQYWLLGLSFAAIIWLPFARPWTGGWGFAATLTALALFTMGSGFLAAAVVLAVVLFRLIGRDAPSRETWPTAAIAAAVVVVGLLTRLEVGQHQHMKAKTVHDFFFYMVHSLQWPFPAGFAGFAIVFWIPWLLVLGLVALRRDRSIGRGAQTIAALGGWVFIQLLATAYARGANADYPAPRYVDTLVFGIMANGLALGWLLERGGLSARPWAVLALFGLFWIGGVTGGIGLTLKNVFEHEVVETKKYHVEAEGHVRSYLATEDRAHLAFVNIPYPSADALIERLSHPAIRALMPVSLRPPLALKSAQAGGSAFAENHASELQMKSATHHGLSPGTPALPALGTWGSYTGDAKATGVWSSSPLTAPLGGWLKFETAGDIGRPGVSLELHDARTDALLATVQPTKVPGDTWRAAYVRAPSVSFVIVARDTDEHRWLAFSAPVEMSRLSHWAWWAAKNGRLIVYIAAGVTIILAAATLALKRFRAAQTDQNPRRATRVPG